MKYPRSPPRLEPVSDKEIRTEYSVRVSDRARRVTLKVAPPEGLVVVIPRNFNRKRIPSLIDEKRQWIEKTLSKVTSQAMTESGVLPPKEYFFPSLEKSLDLKAPNAASCLRSIAYSHLLPRAQVLSQKTGLRPVSFTFRNQKRIWGSCNSRGNISLNQKLLFFEPPLVDYVILHELCHLEHRDHSSSFWTFLSSFDPHFMDHRREIRTAQWTIPAWAY
ncbi:MAG: DUF45 domain-containing protein [Synergistales bacterium]|nr:DUF45 domain-containing protein [Synergistales bacterium]